MTTIVAKVIIDGLEETVIKQGETNRIRVSLDIVIKYLNMTILV
jgi:hypothetical protein